MSEPNTPNPKPPISEARRRANIRNAQLSTGPRSESGKNRSKFNNLKFGVYAESLIIPGESAEDLQERCDEWEKDLGAVTAPERYEVLNAVHATWRHDRMRRAEAAALAEVIEQTTERFHDQKAQETRDLVDRLADSPFEVITALRSTTAGLDWMIGQVRLLAEWLTVSYGFQRTHRIRAIHLCGKRPVDLFDDPAVWHWNWLNLGTGDRGDLSPRDWALLVLADEKPPEMTRVDFEVRLEVFTRNLPTLAEAHAQLKQKVAAMLAELTERRELIALREERGLARAIEKAKDDAGPARAKRQQVENSMDRLRRMSLKELRSLQNSRPEPGDPDDDVTPSAPGPDPQSHPENGPTAPAPEPEPETHRDGPESAEPTVATAATGNGVTTGSAASATAPAQPVQTASADTTEESDPPQKCGAEPTCQNGSRPREVATDDGAGAGLIRLSLTRECPVVSKGDAPYEPKDPELAEIHREIEAFRQSQRLRDEQHAQERQERRERLEQAEKEQRAERAREIDAVFGIDGDRPVPGRHDRVAGEEAGRPPPAHGTA